MSEAAPTLAPAPSLQPPAQGEAFSASLLGWFDTHGRKDLPWQRTPTPYRVWVSEIMLQQTQVATVIGYFDRFVAQLPDVASLASAPLDTVLHLWSGLGYYARARNLHKAAMLIMSRHQGEFPQSLAEVEALPGIGRSTAGAILSLSLGQRHPILDGNVKRVLARFAGIDGFPGDKAIAARLWQLAGQLMPTGRPAAYTQAIMDLGATVCVRARPRCQVCPVAAACTARAHGWQGRLPAAKPRVARTQKSAHVVIAVEPGGAVLLERRPASGIWGGLWSFPQFDSEAEARQWTGGKQQATGYRPRPVLQQQTTDNGLQATARMNKMVRWPVYHHSFTHFDLKLQPWVIQNAVRDARIAENDRYRWYDPRNPAHIGLAMPVIKLINAVTEATRSAGDQHLQSTLPK